MGADIHSVAQVRIQDEDSEQVAWHTVMRRVGGDERNYAAFGLLAGVRGEIGPAYEQRGLPEGFQVVNGEDHPVSPAVPPSKYLYADKCYDDYRRIYSLQMRRSANAWMGDHSHSWLTLGELKKIQRHKDDGAWLIPQVLSDLEELKAFYGVESDEDVRFVFGFDS